MSGDDATRTQLDVNAGAAITQTTTAARAPGEDGRFLPGTVIAGRYRIATMLGRGGMGEVYRAADLRVGQQVSLKFLPESLSQDPHVLERFSSEVRMARQVSHPNVCRVYDLGEVEGIQFLSMEYVDGEDLASLLRRIGRLPSDKATQMARQLCAGLAAAHERGVLHRDLKPANLMVDGQGQLRVMDFGLAGVANQIPGSDVRSGTPAYMAPEQLAGREVSVRSDIYALGLVLYEMFTGRKPFGQAKTLEELRKLQESSAADLSLTQHAADIDPITERAILRCLEPDPAKRPPSVLSVAASLPGGDPLAAALAAGETPSPELVAASGSHEGMAVPWAVACLALTVAALGLAAWVTGFNSAPVRYGLPLPPQALAAKAEDLARRMGYPAPGDSTYGFGYSSQALEYVGHRSTKPEDRRRIVEGRPGLAIFSYRASPRALISNSIGGVGRNDPPMTLSGMATVVLDPAGRLIEFEGVPPQFDERPAPAKPMDWSPLFTAAGLDLAAFSETTPKWVPAQSNDARRAWTGKLNGLDVRVEAASWRDQPVMFTTIWPWTRPLRQVERDKTQGERIVQVFGGVIIVTLLTVTLIFVVRNLRQGRGDRQGALALSAFVFLSGIAAGVLGDHHPGMTGWIAHSYISAARSAFLAVVSWMLYLALEPQLRKRWPQMLISWTRMLSGRGNDPLVAAHVLAGLAIGSGLTAFFVGFEWLAWQRQSEAALTSLRALDGFGPMLGHLATAFSILTVVNPILNVLVLLLFRAVLRRDMLAAVAFLVIFTAQNVLRSEAPGIALIENGAAISLYLVALFRFGLLGAAAMAVVLALPGSFLLTLDFSSWYAMQSLVPLAAVTSVAVWAFRTTVAGRRVIPQSFLDG